MEKIHTIGLNWMQCDNVSYLVQNLASPSKNPMSTIIYDNLPIWREHNPQFKGMFHENLAYPLKNSRFNSLINFNSLLTIFETRAIFRSCALKQKLKSEPKSLPP